MEFNVKKMREAAVEFYTDRDGTERGQLICPVCRKRTGTRVQRDTVIENMPLFCYRSCHSISVISYRDGKQVLSE